MNKQEFISSLTELNLTLTTEQIEMLSIYYQMLIDYNKHTNITALKTEEDIYLKHFYDSLTLNKYLQKDSKVLDIGTGAGFPGMVLAIVNPDIQFVLLDANHKKIQFLQILNERLKLKNVTFVCARAEEYVKVHKSEFDIVTSRAVAELRILLELSLPALKDKGLFLPMKANVEEELAKSGDTLEILGGKIKAIDKFYLPKENSLRTILVIERIPKNLDKYPRTYDKILKKPLKK